MPWSPDEFAARHNKKLRGKAARGASEAADAALAAGKSEDAAVRIGNYVGNRVARHGSRKDRDQKQKRLYDHPRSRKT